MSKTSEWNLSFELGNESKWNKMHLLHVDWLPRGFNVINILFALSFSFFFLIYLIAGTWVFNHSVFSMEAHIGFGLQLESNENIFTVRIKSSSLFIAYLHTHVSQRHTHDGNAFVSVVFFFCCYVLNNTYKRNGISGKVWNFHSTTQFRLYHLWQYFQNQFPELYIRICMSHVYDLWFVWHVYRECENSYNCV